MTNFVRIELPGGQMGLKQRMCVTGVKVHWGCHSALGVLSGDRCEAFLGLVEELVRRAAVQLYH
jgi:hypothetical protein